MNVAVPAPGARPALPAWRLVAALGTAGVLAGLLLVFVDQATRDRIEAHRRDTLRAAVDEVLAGPAKVVSLAVGAGALVPEADVTWSVDTQRIDRVFLGYADEAGTRPVGFAIAAERSGFQDAIRLIFGYDPRTKQVLGLRVLESKETPGLGDKIEKDAGWVARFDGPTAPLVAVKPGRGTGAPGEVDTITGATISSAAVIRIVNEALARLAGPLDAWAREAGR